MTDLIFKELDRAVIIETFDCGDQAINNFLNNLALLNQEQKLSKTYTFCLKDSNIIIAFLTLSASQLNTEMQGYLGLIKYQ